ncbi:MAG: DUF859 family phage minor structural protein [Saccharofermentanales bacterium]|jgi:hypothetical protein|nr:DUF859 family phage minor structural protein [Bacillota bacterium]NLB08438.1 hypothetical protein [Clostridiales bacterium]
MATSGQTAVVWLFSNTHGYFVRWTRTAVDVTNNTSTVKAELCVELKPNYGYYGSNRTSQIRLDGTTYDLPNPGISSPGAGTWVLGTATKVLTHNSDGTRSFVLGGRHRAPGYSDSAYIPDETFVLDAIPRATEITAFSNFNSDSTSISVTLDRKSSSFTHEITLKVAGTNIVTWTGTAANFTGAGTLSLSTEQRNAILTAMPTTTTATATVTVVTKSGTTTVGSRSRNATYTIQANVVPTISNVLVTVTTPQGAITGTARNYAVQNVSTIKVQYSRAAPTGATIKTAKVELGAASSTANPASFTPTASGSNAIKITVTDSRGRSAIHNNSVSVVAYTALIAQVTELTRLPSQQTNMRLKVKLTVGAITYGSNTTNGFNIKVETVPVDGSEPSSTPYNQTWNPGSASETVYTITPSTVYLETKAYNVTITVKDDFSTVTLVGRLSTASFPLVMGKIGIGVGKVPESGRVLDVAGSVYFDGLLIKPSAISGALIKDPELIPANSDLNNYMREGHFYCSTNAAVATLLNCPTGNAFSMSVEKHAGYCQRLITYHTHLWVEYIRNYYNGTWGPWRRIAIFGYDFQAGSGNVGALTAGQVYSQNVTLPVAFPSDSYSVIVTGNNTGVPAVFGVTTRTTTYFTVQARALANSGSGYFHWIAMMR